MFPVGRRIQISAHPVQEQAHIWVERCGEVNEEALLRRLEPSEPLSMPVARLLSWLSDGSGILPRRDNASSDPDVLLLKRPSLEVCRKNLVGTPQLSLLNCEKGVGMAEEDAEDVISVLLESGPPLLTMKIEYKGNPFDNFSEYIVYNKGSNKLITKFI